MARACHMLPVVDIAHLELDEVAASQLAIDAEVKQRELSNAAFHMQSNSERPDVFKLERCLLANDLALVPYADLECPVQATSSVQMTSTPRPKAELQVNEFLARERTLSSLLTRAAARAREAT